MIFSYVVGPHITAATWQCICLFDKNVMIESDVIISTSLSCCRFVS